MTAPVQVGPSPSGGGLMPVFSDREVQFLQRLARGETLQEVAREDNFSDSGIRWFAKRLRTKMGARTNEQLVFLSCQLGILEPKRRHGDHAGFAAHRYRKEEPCDECWEGERAYRRAMKAARKAAKAPRNAPETWTS